MSTQIASPLAFKRFGLSPEPLSPTCQIRGCAKPASGRYQAHANVLHGKAFRVFNFCSRECRAKYRTRVRELKEQDRHVARLQNIFEQREKDIAAAMRKNMPQASISELALAWDERACAEIQSEMIRQKPELKGAIEGQKTFHSVMENYFEYRATPSIKARDYEKIFSKQSEQRRDARLVRSKAIEYVLDIDMAARRALARIPALLKIYQLVWQEQKDTVDNVPLLCRWAIEALVGRELKRLDLFPGRYFRPVRVS